MNTQTTKPIQLLIVDDHQMVRAGLRQLLSLDADIRVVGEAASAAEAVAAAGQLRPDVVLMDLRLPDGTGLEACREINSTYPGPRVLFLTSYSDRDALEATLLGAAAGYLLKDIRHDDLIRAVKDAAAGRPVFKPEALTPLRAEISRLVEGRAANVLGLSPQERRVLALVVEGQTNREIAAALRLSEKTIKNYLSNAFQKLQVKRRAQAAALFVTARRGGAPDE